MPTEVTQTQELQTAGYEPTKTDTNYGWTFSARRTFYENPGNALEIVCLPE